MVFLLKLIVPFLVLSNPNLAYANPAIATMVWEVRTAGSNDNGGCYDSTAATTDYSVQDTAQLTLTDLATSGIGITSLTSATGGFTAAMVGNCIQIKSGTNDTPGFYKVTVYTDTNTVTLDRAPDDGVGGVSSGTGSLGGALAHPDKADSYLSYNAGNIIYIKAGTYTGTAWSLNTNSDGGNGTPIVFEGYNTTRGDQPHDGSRPIFDGESTLADVLWTSGANGVAFFNLVFTGGTDKGIQTASSSSNKLFFFNVRSHNNGSDGVFNEATAYFIGCELDNNGSDGFVIQNDRTSMFFYSYIHNNTDAGVYSISGGVPNVINSIFSTNGSSGLDTANNHFNYIVNSIAWNNTTNGIKTNPSARSDILINHIYNNIIEDNGTYGISFGDTDFFHYEDFNSFSNNTTANILNGAWGGDNDVLENAGITATDWGLNAGSAMIDAGLDPGTFDSSINIFYNIGLDQANPDAVGACVGSVIFR